MIGIEKESTFLSFVAKLTQHLLFRAVLEDITKMPHALLPGLDLARFLDALHESTREVENTVNGLFNMKPEAAVGLQALPISDFQELLPRPTLPTFTLEVIFILVKSESFNLKNTSLFFSRFLILHRYEQNIVYLSVDPSIQGLDPSGNVLLYRILQPLVEPSQILKLNLPAKRDTDTLPVENSRIVV